MSNFTRTCSRRKALNLHLPNPQLFSYMLASIALQSGDELALKQLYHQRVALLQVMTPALLGLHPDLPRNREHTHTHTHTHAHTHTTGEGNCFLVVLKAEHEFASKKHRIYLFLVWGGGCRVRFLVWGGDCRVRVWGGGCRQVAFGFQRVVYSFK